MQTISSISGHDFFHLKRNRTVAGRFLQFEEKKRKMVAVRGPCRKVRADGMGPNASIFGLPFQEENSIALKILSCKIAIATFVEGAAPSDRMSL